MKIVLCLIACCLFACSSNPNKAQEISTELKKTEEVGQGVSLGLNKSGEMVTSEKRKMVDYLKSLQSEVYELEAEIYGNEKLGRKGLWGALRECLDSARAKKLGGDGKAAVAPQKTILTAKESQEFSKIGIDENSELVGVKEEYLLDRTKRFENYKINYLKQKEDFEDQLRACQVVLKEGN